MAKKKAQKKATKKATKKTTKKTKKNAEKSGATIGFEAKLWEIADGLRGNLEPAVYKYDVLGLIFLKYISDRFLHFQQALAEQEGADPEDRDEYLAENVFWVPKKARWPELQKAARQDTIGVTLDQAMAAVEKENETLKGVLHKNYARPELDKRRLGELIDKIATIELQDESHKSEDLLGRVYEYFVGKFASAEGKSGGEFYTPQCVVRLLVSMLAPGEGDRIYDPACGSGGMFVQSEWFIETHGGRRGKAAFYGQELNHTTWKLCKMNLAIRGLDGDIDEGDTFHAPQHPDLKADIVLANPPFNISDWGAEHLQDDKRWKWGTPPDGNANYAWISHFLHHLAPKGMAGFVMANGSMSTSTTAEKAMRAKWVQDDMVGCIVALPGQLFYTTAIPVCLWFMTKAKPGARKGETLFIDARKVGALVDRTHRELSAEDITRIAGVYDAWLGREGAGDYEDELGFCASASLEEIEKHGFVLTPGRYCGSAVEEDDGEPFEVRFPALVATLEEQFAEAAELQAAIRNSLSGISE
jgi:type I restriction enzyme M protein